MWLMLFIMLSPAEADYTRSGPSYIEEARIILSEGRKAFGLGQYETAAQQFQRFVDRYPGNPGYRDAHLLLGLTRLRLNQPKKALVSFKHFVESSPTDPESFRARVLIARAHLKLRQFSEALLVAQEVITLSQKRAVSRESFLAAFLAKTWAQIGLNQDFRASQSLTAFRRNQSTNSEQLTEALRLETELKLRECSRYPGEGPEKEADVQMKMKKRSSCLLEALVLYRNAIRAGNDQWIQSTQIAIAHGFKDYHWQCANPPAPEGKRSATELRRYREELSDRLVPECQEHNQKAVEILASWRGGLKGKSVYLKQMEDRIKRAHGK